jgi:trimethylamine--corrinoid protein Co-methyltransferase
MDEKRNIRSIQPKLKMDVLSFDDIVKIHEASLEIMEVVGVRFPSEKALNILEEAGAQIDRNSMIARIPATLVMDAIAKAPSHYTLAGRDMRNDLVLDGKHCYLSTDGCGIEVYDLQTGIKRTSTKKDIEDSALIADYQDCIAFYWGPMVSAQDTPAEVRPLHELEAAFTHTTKHIQPETIITEPIAKYAVEMGAAITGGRQELRKHPIFSVMQCATDPLGQDKGSLEASLVAAEAGIPTGFMPMPMCCATAPATLAGNLVITTVDSLSPLVLIQIAHPGAPVFFAAAPTAMDLRTGGYTGGGPEDHLLAIAFNQICDFYHIPLSMGAFATGAKEPDWQAAVDNSLAGFMPVLSHTALLTGVGLLNGSQILSYQQMIMDCEIYNIIEKIAAGITVNAETLAVDIIKKVGVGGNFLAEKHTRKHMHNIWQPTVFDRSPYDAWEAGGKKGSFHKATEKAKWILGNHKPIPLESALQAELKRIIRAAEKESTR